MVSFKGENEPYQVRFLSKLTVYTESGTTRKFIIESEGTIVRTTPQFPENVTGFFFNKLMQTWRIAEEQPATGNETESQETM